MKSILILLLLLLPTFSFCQLSANVNVGFGVLGNVTTYSNYTTHTQTATSDLRIIGLNANYLHRSNIVIGIGALYEANTLNVQYGERLVFYYGDRIVHVSTENSRLLSELNKLYIRPHIGYVFNIGKFNITPKISSLFNVFSDNNAQITNTKLLSDPFGTKNDLEISPQFTQDDHKMIVPSVGIGYSINNNISASAEIMHYPNRVELSASESNETHITDNSLTISLGLGYSF